MKPSRKIKKIFLIAVSIFYFLPQVKAQDNSDQNSFPTSPNTGGQSLENSSVSLATGSVQFSIPLYDVKCGSLDLPITLGYSYNGFMPMQDASWTGLGWNLMAGGVVSRNIQGNVDGSRTAGFNYQDYSVSDSLFQTNNSNFLKQLYDNTNLSSYDGAPDIYSCNFNGYSGSFYWYEGKAYMLGYNKEFGINWTGTGPTITTGDGTTYVFSTVEASDGRYPLHHTGINFNSSYYLSTVISADHKDTISLNYSTTTWNQPTSSMYSVYVQGTYFDDNAPPPDSAIVHTPVLQSIVCRNAIVNFVPSSISRTDIEGTQPYLQEIDVVEPASNSIVKKIGFSYAYISSANTPNYLDEWLQLKKCSLVDPANASDQQNYTFSYISLNGNSYPAKDGGEQDPWGFYTLKGFEFTQDDFYRYPNFAYSSLTAMDTITFPTGGYSVFAYEPNDYDSTASQHFALGPGIRIKSISQFLPGSTTPASSVSYTYRTDNGLASSGVLQHDSIIAGPIYIKDTLMFNKYVLQTNDPGDQVRNNQLFYTKVSEQKGTGNERHRTDYYFQSFSTHQPDIEMTQKVDYLYDPATNVYKPQSAASNQFTISTDTTFLLLYPYIDSSYVSNNNLVYKYGYAYTYNNTYWKRPASQRVVQYDIQGDSSVTSSRYHYNANRNLDSVIQQLADGRTLIQRFKRPEEYSAMLMGNMVTAHVIDPVVEKQNWVRIGSGSAYMISGQITQYDQNLFKPINTYGTEAILPVMSLANETMSGGLFTTLLSDTSLYRLKAQLSYDVNDNVIQSNKASDISTVYLYDYQHSLRVAQVENAAAGQVAYSSFEADGQGGWSTSYSTTGDLSSPTGVKCLVMTGGGSVTCSNLTTGNAYIVSYWSKNGSYSVSGSTALLTGKTIDGWTYYEHKVTALGTQVSINGSGYIDELRLYPQNALMTTYTYNPLIGMGTKCDPDNRITYYFYDSRGRLRYVKDQDKNIVRTLDYHVKNTF